MGRNTKTKFLLITHAGVAPRTEPGADSEQKMPGRDILGSGCDVAKLLGGGIRKEDC